MLNYLAERPPPLRIVQQELLIAPGSREINTVVDEPLADLRTEYIQSLCIS